MCLNTYFWQFTKATHRLHEGLIFGPYTELVHQMTGGKEMIHRNLKMKVLPIALASAVALTGTTSFSLSAEAHAPGNNQGKAPEHSQGKGKGGHKKDKVKTT